MLGQVTEKDTKGTLQRKMIFYHTILYYALFVSVFLEQLEQSKILKSDMVAHTSQ